jgi:protein-S-isoprenylcysteine O-methyltransferase Ste14
VINDVNERSIRSQVRHYRLFGYINMGRAAIVIAVGAILFFWAITGKFASDSGTVGPQGIMVVGVLISSVILLIGIIWFRRLLYDLRVGIKTYEQALRSGVRII